MARDRNVVANELWEQIADGSIAGAGIAPKADSLLKELITVEGRPAQPSEDTEIVQYEVKGGGKIKVQPDLAAGRYLASAGVPDFASQADAAGDPVVIQTTDGSVTVGPDDPLARASQSIDRLSKIKF